ncbi:MAG: hypothetical protein ACK4GE_04140 [Caldimicrobium sp.]
MRKILLISLGVLMLGSVSVAYSTESCLKCHKSDAKLAEKIKKSGAKSEAELVDFLRNKSSKKAIHKSLKDEEIKNAFAKINSAQKNKKALQESSKAKKNEKGLKDKNETAAPKKKVEGC